MQQHSDVPPSPAEHTSTGSGVQTTALDGGTGPARIEDNGVETHSMQAYRLIVGAALCVPVVLVQTTWVLCAHIMFWATIGAPYTHLGAQTIPAILQTFATGRFTDSGI